MTDEMTPGAMQDVRRRELSDGGLIEFESAPAGWLTKKGEPRLKDWRAYFYTPPEGKRVRLPSASTILDAICPKGGLPFWAEARGIEGAVEAVRRGELDPAQASAAEAVERVRALRLGADRARDEAADRGINVHALLERYMLTGEPPDPGEHPVEHRGYLQALTRFLLDVDPEPVNVEELVCSPADGYAGRYDLKARVGGRLVLYDAKTQERCGIYDSAHLQAALYERADVACGGEPVDEQRVVVFAADGEYREMIGAATPAVVEAALSFWQAMRPILSACESANRFERNARKVAA